MSSRRSRRSGGRRGGGGNADMSSLSAGLGMSLEDVQKMMSSAGGDGVPPPRSTRATAAATDSTSTAAAGLWSNFVGGDIKLTEAEEEAEKRRKADKITATGRNYIVPVDTKLVSYPGILAQAGTLDASLAGRAPLMAAYNGTWSTCCDYFHQCFFSTYSPSISRLGCICITGFSPR